MEVDVAESLEKTRAVDPNDDLKCRFLQALDETGCYTDASKRIKRNRQTVLRWRKADPAFAECCEDIKESKVDRLEMSAYERAVHGTVEPVLYKGRPVQYQGEVLMKRTYETALTIFMLKNLRPSVFRDGVTHEVESRRTGVLVVPADISEEDWIREHSRGRGEDDK